MRVINHLINFLALVAGVCLGLQVAVVCVDVAARYLHLFSMPWSYDFAEHAMYAITFLGAPWVLRQNGHISVDILLDLLGPSRPYVERIALALGAVVCAVLFYYSALACWQSYQAGTQIYRTFVLPEWWLLAIAPPVFLLLLVIFLERLFRRGPGTAAAASIGEE